MNLHITSLCKVHEQPHKQYHKCPNSLSNTLVNFHQLTSVKRPTKSCRPSHFYVHVQQFSSQYDLKVFEESQLIPNKIKKKEISSKKFEKQSLWQNTI